jgi:hypothetical protein
LSEVYKGSLNFNSSLSNKKAGESIVVIYSSGMAREKLKTYCLSPDCRYTFDVKAKIRLIYLFRPAVSMRISISSFSFMTA